MKHCIKILLMIAISCSAPLPGSDNSCCEIFYPNHELDFNFVSKHSFSISETDDSRLATKEVNDSVTLEFYINDQDAIWLETWRIRFPSYDESKMSQWISDNEGVIKGTLCESPHNVIYLSEEDSIKDFGNPTHHLVFVAQGVYSRAYFNCVFSEENDGSALLRLEHEFPAFKINKSD